MAKYRADFYDEADDKSPVRTETIEADSQDEAAKKAMEKKLPHEKRVDVTPL